MVRFSLYSLYALGGLLQAAVAAPGSVGSVKPRAQGPVKYTLDITWEVGNPNGNAREMTKVNGQYPGPPLYFDEGDDVEITVNNHMAVNTSIHWHGIEMTGTPWSDGMPGLSQTPIEPGESFIYRFKAYPSGTYWYHSHSRMDLLDGLYGPLIIRHPVEAPAPWKLIENSTNCTQAHMTAAAQDPTIVTLSEWTNFTAETYIKVEEESELNIFCVDSLLINGKGAIYCPGVPELMDNLPPIILENLFGDNLTDKGCLPFNQLTQMEYLPGHPEVIPKGLQEGCVETEGETAVIEVDQHKFGGWVSLNIVMASTLRIGIFSVDYHDFWVYEVDGSYVEPVRAQSVAMYPGMRVAVMMKLDQTPADYNIRFGDGGAQIVSAYAVLRYKDGTPLPDYKLGYVLPSLQTEGYILYGGQAINDSIIQHDTRNATPPYPAYAPPPPKEDDQMVVLFMGRYNASWRYALSGKEPYSPDRSAYAPLLYYPEGEDAKDENLIIRTKNGTWVDIVFQVGALPGEWWEIDHAIHKHGSKFWVIGRGYGIWNYTSVAEAVKAEPLQFNLVNPDLRDSATTEFVGAMWIVVRYQSNNPGAWMIHCHVETHLAGGMGMAILDGYDVWPTIPEQYALGRNGH